MFNFEYVGNLHIHSNWSDGGGTVSEIANAAAAAGLDFICLNDHAYMTDDLHIDEEGFYEELLVLVGLELGVRFHHYLAYDLKERVTQHNFRPQEIIDHVKAQGGFGFLAHPFEKGMPFREKSVAYTWNDLGVTGYTGICIWNFTSRWKERVKTAFHGIFHLAFKRQLLKGPSEKTLSFWDSQCRERRVVAVGGSDAHAAVFTLGQVSFKPLSYEHLLNTINIHILLNKRLPKDFREAKKEVYGAMMEGRLFIAHDDLTPAKGFKLDFISDDGSDLYMGEEGIFHPGDLVIELPREGEIRLVRDGKVVKKWRGMEAVYRVNEKGTYRVEVYRRLWLFGWRPWIFSNPIYLR